MSWEVARDVIAWLIEKPPWASIIFWGLVLHATYMLRRLERADTTFRIAQFIMTSDGRADKYSLAYCTVLFVGCWGIWYQATHDGITEWLWTSLIGAFVLGAAIKTGASVAERVKMAQVANPAQPDPPANIEQQVVVTPNAQPAAIARVEPEAKPVRRKPPKGD